MRELSEVNVVITGATGMVGGLVLEQASSSPSIEDSSICRPTGGPSPSNASYYRCGPTRGCLDARAWGELRLGRPRRADKVVAGSTATAYPLVANIPGRTRDPLADPGSVPHGGLP